MACTDGQNGMIFDANDRFLLVFGYPREEVVGRSTRDIDIWVDLDDRDRLLEIAVTQGSVREAHCQLRTKEGDVRDVVLSIEVLRDGGQATFLWMVTDITERKRSDDELRMQSRVLESMREGVNVTDTESGTILFSNAACDAMFGYERGMMVGVHVSRLYDLPQRETDEMMARIREALRTTGSWSGEMRNRRRDGQPFTSRVKISVVDILGRSCTVAVREDTTEQKSLESRLFRAQRLEALGSLAGGIAHDMNNILAPIMMAVPLLRMEQNDPAEEKLLGTIEASAMRGAHLVKQLHQFGRGVEGNRGLVSLKATVV
jgi:two-component system cell cycle sensor histidine kinase/response regulator CckA